MKKININQITQVEINLKEKHTIKWCDAIIYKWWEKLMWLSLISDEPAGYYDNWPRNFYKNNDELLSEVKDIYIEDRVVYRKPYIKIKLSDGCHTIQRFEKEDELNNFMKENEFDKKPWITIT
jgi:hypothetical protein